MKTQSRVPQRVKRLRNADVKIFYEIHLSARLFFCHFKFWTASNEKQKPLIQRKEKDKKKIQSIDKHAYGSTRDQTKQQLQRLVRRKEMKTRIAKIKFFIWPL